MNIPEVNTRLGVTKIDADFETRLTVDEALKIAGANWNVRKLPVYDGDMQVINGFSRIVRDDNNNVLNICKSSYEPISNRKVFNIINDVLGQSQAQIERVGSVKNGRIVFLQAKMPESIEVLKNDNMNMYINAITSHDGSHLAKVFFSATRIACQNQLRAFSKEGRKNRNISIRHTKNADIKLSNAAAILMDGSKEWNVIKENASILVSKSVDRQKTKDFINTLFPAPTDNTKKDMNLSKRQKLTELIHYGKGTEIQGVKGTAWGLYNAATEWYEHHSSIKKDTSRSVRSLLDGDKFRDKVFELAIA